MIFISPSNVGMGDDVKSELLSKGVKFSEESDLNRVLPDVDVVYQTRIQHERFASEAEYEEARGKYVIDTNAMNALSPNAIVMHPLPRVDEIDPAVDMDPTGRLFPPGT